MGVACPPRKFATEPLFLLPFVGSKVFQRTEIQTGVETNDRETTFGQAGDQWRATPQDVLLEIGTGLGYQLAILAELVGHVWSVEIVEEFANEAERRLADATAFECMCS
jgi:protein-L-isoaspartate O-methyltransferase